MGGHIETVGYHAAFCIFGEPEAGKSVCMAEVVKYLETRDTVVWLFDPEREHKQPKRGVLARPAIIRPDLIPESGEHFEFVEQMWCAALGIGGITLALEETETAIRNGKVGPWFREGIKRGRHYPRDNPRAVGCVVLSQSPGDLPPVCAAYWRHLFLYRLTGHRDLERVRQMGVDVNSVRTLKQGECIHVVRGNAPHHHSTAAQIQACLRKGV